MSITSNFCGRHFRLGKRGKKPSTFILVQRVVSIICIVSKLFLKSQCLSGPEDRTPDGSSVIASNGGSGLVWSDHGCRRENGEAHHDLSSKSPRGGGGGKMSNGAAAGSSSAAELEYMEKELPEEKKSSSKGSSSSAPSAKESRKSKEAAKLTKEEMAAKLEQDIKRLKTELQQSRNKENDLRDQIISYMSGEFLCLSHCLSMFNCLGSFRRAPSQV